MNNELPIKPDRGIKKIPMSNPNTPKRAVKRETKSRKKRSSMVTPEQRREMIAVAAYYIAEKRGFTAGNDLYDWAQAEIEIYQRLGKETHS
jgi:hypothetical protein